MKLSAGFDLASAIPRIEEAAWREVSEAGRALADTARANAPVDTGRLRQSITVLEDRANLRVTVTAAAPYAPYVEFGFVHYLSGKYIPPNPFFRRSIDDIRVRFPGLMTSAIRSRIPENKGS